MMYIPNQVIGRLTLFLFAMALMASLSAQATKPFSRQTLKELPDVESKVNYLLSHMTLEEKIGQMTQVRHFSDIKDEDITNKFIGSVIHTDGPQPGEGAIGWQSHFANLQHRALATRLGIPLTFGVDAVHGQNTYNGATIFPHNIGMGATNNPKLVEEAAAITALEAQATGFNWVFSPCIAIPYNERWGRVYEAFSESTPMTSKYVRASVKGHQGDLSSPKTVMATAKHFVGDGATDLGKEGGKTTISMEEISERLMTPYKEAVDAGIGAIMVSFNTVEDLYMHAHKKLITDSLKNGWGFDGIVVSDWKGYSRFGENELVNAGVDVLMAVDGDLDVFQNGLKKAVGDGTVPLERVDDAVRRILKRKFLLGLFENPYPHPELIPYIGHSDHRAKAQQAVRESMVLLKNKKKALPIDKKAKKIVVVGAHANNTGLQSGGWTITWQGKKENYVGASTILKGIETMAEGEVVYDSLGSGEHTDADVAVVFVGEDPYAEFFGDVNHGTGDFKLTLSEEQQNMISAYDGKGPKLVVVLLSGRPMVTTDQIKQSDAFVAAWLIGSEGGGVAEVLFGDYNFTGKLPHSWPKTMKDMEGQFGPNYWDDSIKPLYEFGYGLRYK